MSHTSQYFVYCNKDSSEHFHHFALRHLFKHLCPLRHLFTTSACLFKPYSTFSSESSEEPHPLSLYSRQVHTQTSSPSSKWADSQEATWCGWGSLEKKTARRMKNLVTTLLKTVAFLRLLKLRPPIVSRGAPAVNIQTPRRGRKIRKRKAKNGTKASKTMPMILVSDWNLY